MVDIDGSDGGGQLFRSALALSMLDGEPVEFEHVRGERTNPGLQPQHLTALETAASVSNAEIDGAEIGSETVSFEPDGLSGGQYEADIGTAGSVTLLFDTFLPLVTEIAEPLSITAIGGTDVKWSPPMAYLRQVKLPLLRRYGVAAAVDCERTGFYPDGGGRATLHLWPSTLSPLDLGTSFGPGVATVYSRAATELADGDVVERQVDATVDALDGLGVETVEIRRSYVDAASPGSVLTVCLDDGTARAGFDAYGAPEKRTEAVASEVADQVRRFRRSTGVVDAHLADQLLVFVALAGGTVEIPGRTPHIDGARSVLDVFDRDLRIERTGDAQTVVADP